MIFQLNFVFSGYDCVCTGQCVCVYFHYIKKSQIDTRFVHYILTLAAETTNIFKVLDGFSYYYQADDGLFRHIIRTAVMRPLLLTTGKKPG